MENAWLAKQQATAKPTRTHADAALLAKSRPIAAASERHGGFSVLAATGITLITGVLLAVAPGFNLGGGGGGGAVVSAAQCINATTRCPPSKPFPRVLRSFHSLKGPGWEFHSRDQGKVRVGLFLQHIAERGIQPEPLPLEQICHKGMERADDAVPPHGLPRGAVEASASAAASASASAAASGSASAAASAASAAGRFSEICKRLRDETRMVHVCAGVPGIAVRSTQNPCRSPFRLVDGAHRLCSFKRDLLEWQAASVRWPESAKPPPCAPHFFVIEEADAVALFAKDDVEFDHSTASAVMEYFKPFIAAGGGTEPVLDADENEEADSRATHAAAATARSLLFPEGDGSRDDIDTLLARSKTALCFRYDEPSGSAALFHCLDISIISNVELKARTAGVAAANWERQLAAAFGVDFADFGFGVTHPLSSTVYPLAMVAKQPKKFVKMLRRMHKQLNFAWAECVLTLRVWEHGSRFASPAQVARIPFADFVRKASDSDAEDGGPGGGVERDDLHPVKEEGVHLRVLDSMRNTGFIVLQLPLEQAQILEAASAAVDELFTLRTELKMAFAEAAGKCGPSKLLGFEATDVKELSFAWVQRQFLCLRQMPSKLPASADVGADTETLTDLEEREVRKHFDDVGLGQVLAALEAALLLQVSIAHRSLELLEKALDLPPRGLRWQTPPGAEADLIYDQTNLRMYKYTSGAAAPPAESEGRDAAAEAAAMFADTSVAFSGDDVEAIDVPRPVSLRPHSDMGLVTVVPLSKTAGLQVLSLAPDEAATADTKNTSAAVEREAQQQREVHGNPGEAEKIEGEAEGHQPSTSAELARWRWVDVEPALQPGEVVVFGGELLGWLTHGEVRPMLHRVSVPQGERDEPTHRFSMPLFLIPKDKSTALTLASDGRRMLTATNWSNAASGLPAGVPISMLNNVFRDVQRDFFVYRDHRHVDCEAPLVDSCQVME